MLRVVVCILGRGEVVPRGLGAAVADVDNGPGRTGRRNDRCDDEPCGEGAGGDLGHAAPERGPGKLVALPRPLTEEQLAFAIPRQDTDRKRQMDQVLARLEFDGRLRLILARWIKAPGR